MTIRYYVKVFADKEKWVDASTPTVRQFDALKFQQICEYVFGIPAKVVFGKPAKVVRVRGGRI
jgi:hypothetical protein